MPTSAIVPATMPRANVRCGSSVSPAENVTYCQPSYAQSTPIMPVIPALSVDREKWSGHHTVSCAPGPPFAINTTASSTITPAFSNVATPWTSALCRVPRILIAETITIMSNGTIRDVSGDNGTKTLKYLGNAAPSVASDP